MRFLFCAMLAVSLAIGYIGAASPANAKTKKPAVSKKPAVELMFEKLDTDKDDKLTLDEYCGTKKDKQREAAEKLFKKYDTDGSGDLTLDEYKMKGRAPKPESK